MSTPIQPNVPASRKSTGDDQRPQTQPQKSSPPSPPSVTTTTSTKKPQPKNNPREAVETIVFVVVLVLLLKLFVTEAFVIPTGSMAETLYGYQKIVTCPKCAHEFPVNATAEVDGVAAPGNPNGPKRRLDLVGFCCPNCRFQGWIRDLPTNPT